MSSALTRYVVLPSPEAITAVTLWIAASHAAPAWNTAARLVIRAPEKRCGKSRLLDVIEAVCHRPVMTVNASPAAIYRLIGIAEGDPPTVLIDEADTIFGPEATHEDLRGLLNAGHQRGRPALRWDVNTRTVEELETYAMVALAGIGRLPDTIEDRAVIIRMRRRARHETVQPYRVRRDAPPLNRLRQRLHAWARADLDTLAQAVPKLPLEDRAADTWEALIVMADYAGGAWPDQARQAAVKLTDEANDPSDETIATQLLADCRTAFDGRSIIRTVELLAALKADLEAPWANFGPNGLTPRLLASTLKEFGIASHVLRFDGGGQQRGYAANDFLDAWSRYLPPSGKGVTSVKASQPQVRAHAERDGSASCDGYVVSQGTAGPPSRARPSPPRNVNDRGGTVTPLIRHSDASRTNGELPLAGDVTE
ncbi:MAG: DUF3631 domain-containing protein [Acidimicrobiales bacterium]